MIIRRERPHPGAQLDLHRPRRPPLPGDPHRPRPATRSRLERLHRARADAEDRIRAAKQTGLDNLPFREFALNEVWLEISLIAHDLIVWTQQLALDGELAELRTEGAALPAAAHRRPARVPRPPRDLRLQASWPWAHELAAAFQRLKTLPPPAG